MLSHTPHIPPQEVDAIVYEALEAFDVPGASVALVVDNETVLAKGYGIRDWEQQLPVTPHTLFPIASCTKAFTSFLLLESEISLDSPVQTYIPEFALWDKKTTTAVTVRDLLAHRTGISRHDPIWCCHEISPSQLLQLLPHLEPECAVGQGFQYSNLMYGVAGILLERVTGESWEARLKSRIFVPLHMDEASVGRPRRGDFALPYAKIGGVVVEVPFRELGAIAPAGGVNATVLDMAKWVQFHLTRPSEAHEVQTKWPDGCYGLGWFVGTYRGHPLVSHGGNIDGFSAEVALLPNERIGLVILTNSGTEGHSAILSIRQQIFNRLLKLEELDTKIECKPGVPTSPQEEATGVDLSSYIGSYEHPGYGVVTICLSKGRLNATYGNWHTDLFCQSNELFFGEYPVLGYYGVPPSIEFRFSVEGRLEVGFERFRNKPPVVFQKKAPPTLLAPR